MKFRSKTLFFKNQSKMPYGRLRVYFFCPGREDVHLKIRLKISKTMIHTHDVINFDINENGQKTFARDHY